MERYIFFYFESEHYKKDFDFIESLKECLLYYSNVFQLPPAFFDFYEDDKQQHKISKIEDTFPKISTSWAANIWSQNKEYHIYTGINNDYNVSFAIKLKESFFKQIQLDLILLFRKTILKLENLLFAYVQHDRIEPDGIRWLSDERLDEFNFKGRRSQFWGFRWLNYFNKREVELNGGEELANLPYLTCAEPLKDGLFIQVGDTFEEGVTNKGQDQL